MSNQFRRQVLKRTALAVVLGACLANGAVYAQSTTGSIYGSAPSEAGSTIVVQSDTGLSRTITVDANGRYNLGSLPVGAYTVTLKRGDQVVDTRKNVQLRVGSGTEVSFADAGRSSTADATTLGAITVTAANAPKIDVSSTSSRSVITSQQLAILPWGAALRQSHCWHRVPWQAAVHLTTARVRLCRLAAQASPKMPTTSTDSMSVIRSAILAA